ncbi:enoyl-CoA hydratase/isomerase family protein [Sphingomonas sp. 28-62-11]|uniref:enoyl-CoA hydratase/isomerase family protein n=1 Tax=Sphingomonas sp. 28-62-11 TaxID=1970432 RepID=UPI000BD18F4B|nr:MAG: hypothetical protein B7Y49_13955 [Sphingomonas sp. 28-62-11]
MSIDQTQSDGVVVLTINRPPVNALDIETVERLRDLAIGMAAAPPIGVLLSGAGQCFSAGVDTRAFGTYTPPDRARMILAISAMITALYALPCPVVAAVSGHALGGGFVLMLAGDVRIAIDDDKAKLGLTEAKAGVPFPAAPLEIIKAELAPELLRRLTLTSQTMPPAALHQLGVIDGLCSADDLLATAEARVRQLADQPAFGLVKQQIRRDTLARLRAIVASGQDSLIEALARG